MAQLQKWPINSHVAAFFIAKWGFYFFYVFNYSWWIKFSLVAQLLRELSRGRRTKLKTINCSNSLIDILINDWLELLLYQQWHMLPFSKFTVLKSALHEHLYTKWYVYIYIFKKKKSLILRSASLFGGSLSHDLMYRNSCFHGWSYVMRKTHTHLEWWGTNSPGSLRHVELYSILEKIPFNKLSIYLVWAGKFRCRWPRNLTRFPFEPQWSLLGCVCHFNKSLVLFCSCF